MEVDKAVEHKQKLVQDIKDLLGNFENASGLYVEGITVDGKKWVSTGSLGAAHTFEIKATVNTTASS